MIASVGVGNGEATVLQHQTDTRDAAAPRIDLAIACGDTSDKGHARTDCLTLDPDRMAGGNAITPAVGGIYAIHGLARGRICTHYHGVSDNVRGTGCNLVEVDRHQATIIGDSHIFGRGFAIDPYGVTAQAQPFRRRVFQDHIILRTQRI